jgi:DNA-binding LacI/PurR family transcriptional regulator
VSQVGAVAERRSAGVILPLGALSGADRALLDRLRIPYVVIDPAEAPVDGVPAVCTTNLSGARGATEHLIRLGHKRIAIVSGPVDRLFMHARRDGYGAAMADAGLSVPGEYVRDGDMESDRAYRETVALLDLPEPPTAIFVCTDRMALGVYAALRGRGIGVPDDISVVGFDDLPESSWVDPPLTTVRQRLAEMGVAATRMLVGLMRGEPLGPRRVELPTTLIERASTAPPPTA